MDNIDPCRSVASSKTLNPRSQLDGEPRHTTIEIRARLTRDDNGVDYDDERLPVRRVARYVTSMLLVCSAAGDAPFVCAKPIEYERNASSFARSGQARSVFSWRGRPVIAVDGTVRFEHVVSSSGTDPDGWVCLLYTSPSPRD